MRVVVTFILRLHSMCPIRRGKGHALSTAVIFIHQLSGMGFITCASIVFQQLQLQSALMHAKDCSTVMAVEGSGG